MKIEYQILLILRYFYVIYRLLGIHLRVMRYLISNFIDVERHVNSQSRTIEARFEESRTAIKSPEGLHLFPHYDAIIPETIMHRRQMSG